MNKLFSRAMIVVTLCLAHTSFAATSISESSNAYAEANQTMHKEMMIQFTGNADVDFAKGMIPHHQGAIDMAKIELQYGKDPELRQLASEIIAAQEKEIQFLKLWLEKNATQGQLINQTEPTTTSHNH